MILTNLDVLLILLILLIYEYYKYHRMIKIELIFAPILPIPFPVW